MVSTDMSFDNIIVQKRHVDIAALLLQSIYDNQIFKLKEFVTEERKQTSCTLSDIELAREMYTRYPSLIQYLENNNNIAKNTLLTISGLDINVFNEAIKRLAQGAFITMTQFKIFPTPKLLIAVKKARTSTNLDSEV
jgi:hypothetical protein